MKRNIVTAMAILALGLFIISCQKSEPVRIGSKNFTENRILSHMIRLMAKEEGLPVHPSLVYGNTFDLQEALKRGEIDAYPEYTGTGGLMLGVGLSDKPEETYQRVRDLFKPFGLVWMSRFGFDNTYTLVMTQKQAAAYNIKTISDIAELDRELVFGADPEFLARSVDGFNSMVLRYGIRETTEVIAQDTRRDLYRNLISGKIHVGVAHKTDPQIQEYGLVLVRDDLDFFSAYEPAPVVRADTLEKYPGFSAALEKLGGLIDEDIMKTLNHSADISGRNEAFVARQFLKEQGLITGDEPVSRAKELVCAFPPSDHRTELTAIAAEAVRFAAAGRNVVVKTVDDPVRDLIAGDAFVAVLGAEHFFEIRPRKLPDRLAGIEAFAPVGDHFAHLIRKKNQAAAKASSASSGKPFRDVKNLGVGLKHGGSARTAMILLDAYNRTQNVSLHYGPLDTQIQQLKIGDLDAVLLMTISGDFHVAQILQDPELDLFPIRGWRQGDRQFRYPFMRESRITPATYPALKDPVDTMRTQVVIAGPRVTPSAIGDGDPMTALRTQRLSIPRALKEKIIAGTDKTETIDPALPGENISLLSRRQEALPLNPQPEVSIATALLVILFFAMLYLVFGQKPGLK
jgi:glycine betaine/choline ABC-type transport system substrate-binding protein